MPKQQIKTIPYALYHNHWIAWKEKVAVGAEKSSLAAKTIGRP